MDRTDLELVARSESGFSRAVAELKRLGPKTLELVQSISLNVGSCALTTSLTSLAACRRHVGLVIGQPRFRSRS